jgi:hypothetical protein
VTDEEGRNAQNWDRYGIGGIHGPLFRDGSFEYIPIPDRFGVDERTYANTTGLKGRPLIEYFPRYRQTKLRDRSIHFDPEFDTFTYGDPTRPKASLRRLEEGDMLVFYCGLEGWNFISEPALYLMGYFEVLAAGRASEFRGNEMRVLFEKNSHVRHQQLYEQQKGDLVLIRGSERSRLLNKATRISAIGQDRTGKPLKVLSPEMQKVFGSFNGRISFQRSPPRWVDAAYVTGAIEFMRSLD